MIREFLIKMKMPEWARWYAIDAKGEVWCFQKKPTKNLDYKVWDTVGHDYGLGYRMARLMTIELGLISDFDWIKALHRIPRG